MEVAATRDDIWPLDMATGTTTTFEPLTVKVRLWVNGEEVSGEQAAILHKDSCALKAKAHRFSFAVFAFEKLP